MALMLLDKTQDDIEQAKELFLHSGLTDEKTLSKRGNKTYVQLTFEKAFLKLKESNDTK